jgi:hypothetical protein
MTSHAVQISCLPFTPDGFTKSLVMMQQFFKGMHDCGDLLEQFY